MPRKSPTRSKTKRPTGRPSKYNPSIPEQAYRLCLLGYTDAELAKFFEISEVTLYAWKKEYPEFLNEILRGRDEADSRVARSMYERAVGYRHRETKVFCQDGAIITHDVEKCYPPDTQAGIFWLSNRQRSKFRDKKDLEHTGKDGGPVTMTIGWEE